MVAVIFYTLGMAVVYKKLHNKLESERVISQQEKRKIHFLSVLSDTETILLNKWLTDNNVARIALCGNEQDMLAICFNYVNKATNNVIDYIISNSVHEKYNGIKVVKFNDDIPYLDLIIITDIEKYETLKSQLGKYTDRVYSIEDIVYEINGKVDKNERD